MGLLNLGVLASGRGSNLQAIIKACDQGQVKAQVQVVISDQENAYALERAKRHGIDAYCLKPSDFADKSAYEEQLVAILEKYQVQLVCLAGYMRLVGKNLLQAYPHAIMNIHPSLLPSFPGLHAHQQAIDYGVKYSGCTVHLVDEGMDSGPIILQAAVPVLDGDDEDTLSERILAQEHLIYPQAIELFASKKVLLQGRKTVIGK